MPELLTHAGLALSAFLSATILPGTSDVALVAAAAAFPGWKISLFLVATVFNVLGGIVNWWMGLNVERFVGTRWFPVSKEKFEKAQAKFQKYGTWALLLSWMPLFGDALTLASGVLKVRLLTFIVLVAIAKGARYAILLLGLVAVT